MYTIPLADLDYDSSEDQAVLDVLHSKWLTMGAVTQAFEQEFAACHTGSGRPAPLAIAVANATQALHLACLALGIFLLVTNPAPQPPSAPRFRLIRGRKDEPQPKKEPQAKPAGAPAGGEPPKGGPPAGGGPPKGGGKPGKKK